MDSGIETPGAFDRQLGRELALHQDALLGAAEGEGGDEVFDGKLFGKLEVGERDVKVPGVTRGFMDNKADVQPERVLVFVGSHCDLDWWQKFASLATDIAIVFIKYGYIITKFAIEVNQNPEIIYII